MNENFDVEWFDAGRGPKCTPDPRYPHGIDVDATQNDEPGCLVLLPYPAARCGFYMLRCHMCEQSTIVTTAGRPDDPRSVKLPCLLVGDGKPQ